MNRSSLLLTLVAALALVAAARPQSVQPNPGQRGVQNPPQMAGGWRVGPSFEELVDKLEELRARKKYDYEHGRRYQAQLAEQIEIVKRALRNHHRSRGQKAARNEPGDYDPPRGR